MGRRLFKVLLVIGYLIIIGTIISVFVEFIQDGLDNGMHIIGMLPLSVVPLLILLVIQYVLFGQIQPFYMFENKSLSAIFGKTILLCYALFFMFWIYQIKVEYDNKKLVDRYIEIRNKTFVDYSRKDHPKFKEEEHLFLHNLIYATNDINMTIANRLSDEALDLATHIRKLQKRRASLMYDFATKTLGYKELGTDKNGVKWAKTIENRFYKWNINLVRKGKR